VNPISRTTALAVGSLVTVCTLAAGTGVAGAATTNTRTAKAERRVELVAARQTRIAHRLDRAAARLEKREVRLTTRVDALADGTAKTDALAKLADLHSQAEAAKANDAKVLAALSALDAQNTSAAQATFKDDRALFKVSVTDLRAARQDARAVLVALKK
jgi:hypothetical protein